ncbi:D-sedoheptulose-7-phosphate isomerase [Candidatus Methylacidiphilum infernorum]|nr:SIS domain-containing protein [Candidatus Methylacidiphilum infernorum]
MAVDTFWIKQKLQERNEIAEKFFFSEAFKIAQASQEASERFLRGGRLLAFGKGSALSDAQHVAVEFVHPVIVGKKALPALDISAHFSSWLSCLCKKEDMVFGFGPIEGDKEIEEALQWASVKGAMTFAFPGKKGNYAVESPVSDPWIFQEIVETIYHTFWETIHVFLEHRPLGYEIGGLEFLYPSLRSSGHDIGPLLDAVSQSILEKLKEDNRLRERVAEEPLAILQAIELLEETRIRGGKVMVMGNGGSATDANDFVLDLISPPVKKARPFPAVSLAMEPALITALLNDVGAEVVFSRQLLAHAQSNDVLVGISTSGNSTNLLRGFEEAKRRGLSTLALVGHDGGEIKRRGLADVSIVVPSNYIPRIQEVQLSIYHVICEALCNPELPV